MERETPKARATCTTTHGNGITSLETSNGWFSACAAELCATICTLHRPPMVGECRKNGLLILTAGAGDVIRLLPPLVATATEVDAAVGIIAEAMRVLDE